MPRRTIAFIVFAAVLAAGCIRLGIWQLSRHGERRAQNAVVEARLATPPASFAEATRDTTTARYRQVQVRGRYDYAHEFVLTSRTRRGAPGVQLLTPVIVAEGAPAILVNRGWVYAPDGMTVDLPRWREADSAVVEGYVDVFLGDAAPVTSPSAPRQLRRLTRDTVAARLPYPLAPYVVVQRAGAGQTGEVQHPFRLDLPALDDGAHRSYAVQWFSFALIAVVGTGFVVARARRPSGADVRAAARARGAAGEGPPGR